jgi:hypothetical protein
VTSTPRSTSRTHPGWRRRGSRARWSTRQVDPATTSGVCHVSGIWIVSAMTDRGEGM